MGRVLYSGYFTSTADFDLGPGVAQVTSQGGNDMFLARYTTGGAFVSVFTISGVSGQTGRGLFIDDANVIYASGYSSGVVDLHPGTEVLSDTAQSTASFYVRLEGDLSTAVTELNATTTFYPNPVRAGQLLTTGLGTGQLRILDTAGRVHMDPGKVSGDGPIAVDLPEGTYLLEWKDGRKQVVRRFVVGR